MVSGGQRTEPVLGSGKLEERGLVVTESFEAETAQRTKPRSIRLVDAISASLSARTRCVSSATSLVDAFEVEEARRLVIREGGPRAPPPTPQGPR